MCRTLGLVFKQCILCHLHRYPVKVCIIPIPADGETEAQGVPFTSEAKLHLLVSLTHALDLSMMP